MKSYPKFAAHELACRCGCGTGEMDEDFMLEVVKIRLELGFPFPVNSAYRCIAHDQKVGGVGIHPTGKCIDLGLYGERAYKLVQAAMEKGFRGIGLKQHGPYDKRFVHIDKMPRQELTIWTYQQ